AELRNGIAHGCIGGEQNLVGKAFIHEILHHTVENTRESQIQVDILPLLGKLNTAAGNLPGPTRMRQQVIHVRIALRNVGDFVEEVVADGSLVQLDEGSYFITLAIPGVIARVVVRYS